MNATIDRIEIVSEPNKMEASDNSKSPVCVWLVDDDNEFRRLLLEALTRQEGIQCARDFSSPDAMLSVLASQIGPDVIVMDVHMGDRNGLDAIAPIKALSRNTQVLMLTSLSDEIGRSRALNEGASDFLLKSYTPEEIVERIRNPRRRVNARRRRLVTENCQGKAERTTKLGGGMPRTNLHPEHQSPPAKSGLAFLRRLFS